MARHLSKTVFVKNLNLNTIEADLQYYFGKGGPIKQIEIEKDDDYRNKGFAYIYYQRPQDAEWAVANMNGFLLDGHRIVVEFNKVRLRRKREDRKYKISILQKELETRIQNEKLNQMKDSPPNIPQNTVSDIPNISTPDTVPKKSIPNSKTSKRRRRSTSSSSSSSSSDSYYYSDSSSSYTYSSSSSYTYSSTTTDNSPSTSSYTYSSTTSETSSSASSYSYSYSTSSYTSTSSDSTPPPRKRKR